MNLTYLLNMNMNMPAKSFKLFFFNMHARGNGTVAATKTLSSYHLVSFESFTL